MTSRPFNIERGVRQGRVASTLYYLVYINELLHQLEESELSLNFGYNLKCGNPALADDLSLIVLSPDYLQKLIDIVHRYATKWKLEISAKKSTFVVFNKSKSDLPIKLTIVNNLMHENDHADQLGIRQSCTLKYHHRIEERCQKAKNAFHALADPGMRCDALNPVTSAELYNKVILPTVLYGCELWNAMSESDGKLVNKFQHYVPRDYKILI